MGPVLFVSASEYGLLNPMLVLAGELAGRDGTEVWFATDEHRRADVERLGDVGFVSLGDATSELCMDTWDDETYRRATRPAHLRALFTIALHMYDPALALGKYRALAAAVDRLRPALLVIDKDLSDYAVRLAIARGIPYVLSVPYMPSNVSETPMGYPAPFSGMRPPTTVREQVAVRLFRLGLVGLKLHPTLLRRAVRYARAAQELGIPSAARNAWSMSEAVAVFSYTVADLDYPFTTPPGLHLFGGMLPPVPQAPDDTDVAPWLDARESVVYIGLGTLTRLTAAQVHAFVAVARELSGEHHVLWKLPKGQQHLLPPDLPPNLRVMSWVPSQLDVLAHPNVRAFVCHGGANGLHEGLYFGKPMLIRPLWADCHDHAVRAADAGVSLTLSQDIDVPTAARDLRRLLTEDSFAERAHHFGALQRKAGGRQAAADTLLDILTTH